MRQPTGSDPSSRRGASLRAAGLGSGTLDPAVFELLLARIEQLSRELGRAEGRQATLERQVARLERQVEELERERGAG
jgi:hypothetical protein